MVRECRDALLATDVLGLGLRDAGVMYGEVHDVGERAPGETPPGERWPKEQLAVVVEGMEMEDMRKPGREGALERIDVAVWAPVDRRGVGEPREAPWPGIMWRPRSSDAGLAARRFCPALAYASSTMCSLFNDDVSSISMSSAKLPWVEVASSLLFRLDLPRGERSGSEPS